MLDTHDGTPTLTESEAVVLGPLLAGAAVMTIAWLVDAAGLAVRPVAILPVAIVAAGIGWARLVRRLAAFSPARLACLLLLVFGHVTYLCWLAWPSLLPISEGPDLVHHLSLIDYIQQRHALPHGHGLGAYLGEMDGYTPGSHLLAALVAGSFRTAGLHVLHPLIAAVVALKAGLVYNLLLRLLPVGRRRAAAAAAGTLLLLVPHAYLLQPFTHFYFYAQVVSETFAVAMFWALVVWNDRPSATWLAVCAACGIAVVLCWPVWLPAPALALTLVVLVHPGRAARERAQDLALALGPIAIAVIAYAAAHAGSAGILSSGGSTVVPAVRLFGWPFLALATGGLVAAARPQPGDSRSGLSWLAVPTRTLPLWAFGAACLAQIAALVALQRALGATNLYLAHKTVHLLVDVMIVFAALALEAAWHGVRRPIPAFGRPWLDWVLPLVVVAWVLRSDLPGRPIHSPITEPVYQAGVWAKAHVPSPCVDYLVPHWLTGYWLHIDVLGNPRQSERMRQETFDYDVIVGHWILPGGLPFGIAEDVERLPADARRNMRVLHRVGRAAVVERSDGQGLCTDETPPIDKVDESGMPMGRGRSTGS